MKKIYYKKYFESKNITKQGFGILGRGIGVAKFLLKNNAKVLITDIKDESFFKEQIKELYNWINKSKIDKSKISFVFGKHREEDFLNCDFIISASGVAKNNHYLNKAKENDVEIYQESTFFLKILQDINLNLKEAEKIKVITITGTRGKTTTTQLIYKILKDNIKDRKIHLAGNIRGISTIELLKKINKKDIIVMETDSWLAQGFKKIKFAPNIAVFTNIMKDHMDYYENNMTEYFSDKAETFLYQKNRDIFIATYFIKKDIEKYLKKDYKTIYKSLKSKKVFLKKEEIGEDKNFFKSNLKGEHNRINISLAIKVAKQFSLKNQDIKKSLKNFKGVSGRLEFVKNKKGVKYYNDTTATTGEATIAAIKSLQDDKNKIILITGGKDKGLNIDKYVDFLIKNKKKNIIKEIIFLNDNTTTGTKMVLNKMKKLNFSDYILTKDLEVAVNTAKDLAKKDEIILFSPGFASFGMFLNEYDRGDKFLKCI